MADDEQTHKTKRMTVLQVNAIITLGVLLLMFGALAYMLHHAIGHAAALGCSATEVIVAILGLQSACVGAVAWVVKKFAEDNGTK